MERIITKNQQQYIVKIRGKNKVTEDMLNYILMTALKDWGVAVVLIKETAYE